MTSGSVPPPAPVSGPVPARARRSRLGIGEGGGRALAIAAVSTIVFFGLLGLVVVNAPGWERVQDK